MTMCSFPDAHAKNAFLFLCNRTNDVNEDLQTQTAPPSHIESEYYNDSESPVLESSVQARGPTAIKEMTKFSMREFQRNYNQFHLNYWKVGTVEGAKRQK